MDGYKNRNIPIYLMSISLKVVSIAQVFWASFKRAAIFWRMRFILTRCSERVPKIWREPSTGGTFTWATAGLTAAGGGAAARGGGGGGRAPGGGGGGGGRAAGGGGGGALPAPGPAAGFGAAGAAGFGGGAGAPAALAGAAPGFNLNSSWPGLTVSPSLTRISVTEPEKGAGTGIVVLSVSISITASSAPNESPTLQVNLMTKNVKNPI